MVIIGEKSGKFLNFFTVSMVVGLGGLLLSFLSNLISIIIVFNLFYLPFDFVITNLLILFLSQFIGIFIVYFLLIPLFKAKNVEYRPITALNSLRTIILICGTFTVIISSIFTLFYIFSVFNLNPLSVYGNVLLRPEHLANPLNILIYYLPLTFGASIYEELIYRRLIIPLLEQRGMKPLVAVLTSSLIFAIAHIPNDIVSGSLSGGIMHIWSVFLIGFSCGLIYILTRNILYPIIIHGVLNFISFSVPLFALTGNSLLILSYDISFWTIFITGIVVLIYGLWQFFRKRNVEWVVLVRERNTESLLNGFTGFIIIATISTFIPILIEFIVVRLEIAVYNVFLYFFILIISYGVAIILFSWLGTRTRYELKNNLIQNQIIKKKIIKKN